MGRDSATKLTKENADLNEKAELNEDELIDLREQFGEMEKEAEQNTLKQKELETEKAKLQESLNAHTQETENLKESQKHWRKKSNPMSWNLHRCEENCKKAAAIHKIWKQYKKKGRQQMKKLLL